MIYAVGGGELGLDCNNTQTGCGVVFEARASVFTTLTLQLLLSESLRAPFLSVRESLELTSILASPSHSRLGTPQHGKILLLASAHRSLAQPNAALLCPLRRRDDPNLSVHPRIQHRRLPTRAHGRCGVGSQYWNDGTFRTTGRGLEVCGETGRVEMACEGFRWKC